MFLNLIHKGGYGIIVVNATTGRVAIPTKLVWLIAENDEFAVIHLVNQTIWTTESFNDVIDKYKEAVK